MPKVAPDVDLQKRVLLFIKEQEISVRKVAQRWSVSNSSLSRFCKTGMALDAMRFQYRRALDREVRRKNETNGTSLNGDNRHVQPLLVRDHEMRRIRLACESVIKLLDAYEGR